MTTQTSSDQVHVLPDATESYKSTVSIPLRPCKLLHDLTTDVLQKLENPNSSSIPAVTEDLQKYDPNVVRLGSPSREVTTPHLDVQKPESQSPGFKTHMDGTNILLLHTGEDVISQAQIDRKLTLQQRDDLAPTREMFDVLRREVDPESVRYHARLQSVLRRVMELERRLGVVHSDKSLRRERIQLGLEVSVAGERGVWASGFPLMIVLLALTTVIIPHAYKYVFSA